jgi:hypothetical protein
MRFRDRPAETPIRRISLILHQWIDSYLYNRKDQHPILASYALDAAEFINTMVCGGHISAPCMDGVRGVSTEIEPLVSGGEKMTGFYFDSSRKRDFTNGDQLNYVVCRVPPDGQLLFQQFHGGGPTRLFGPGEEFEFKNGRCYLSEDWDRGGYAATISGEEPYRLDLQSEFVLQGSLRNHREMNNSPYAAHSADVPAHWVVAALDHDGKRSPVPFGEDGCP